MVPGSRRQRMRQRGPSKLQMLVLRLTCMDPNRNAHRSPQTHTDTQADEVRHTTLASRLRPVIIYTVTGEERMCVCGAGL